MQLFSYYEVVPISFPVGGSTSYQELFSNYFQANCSNQKCDANRLHATDWPGSKITG